MRNPAGRRVGLGVWQGPAVATDLEANLRAVETAVIDAADRGVEVVLFPELFLSGYDCTEKELRSGAAVSQSSPQIGQVRDLAKSTGVAVALPYAELDGSRLYNSCILIDAKGQTVINYRKVNLWGPWEQSVFSRGAPHDLRVAELTLKSGCVFTTGVCICYDIEFPEPARCLAVHGAEILLVPTALGAGDVDSSTPMRTVPSRAMENHVFIAYSNLEGSARNLPDQNVPSFCGRSAVVGPDGEDIVRAGISTGGLLLATNLGLDDHASCRQRNPYLEDRQQRLAEGHYKALTDTAEGVQLKAKPEATGDDPQQAPSLHYSLSGLKFTTHKYASEHDAQFLRLFLPDERHRWLATPGTGKLPVFFIIHGGFWKNQWHIDNTATTTLVADFLQRSFAVVLVEYRRRDMPGGTYPGPELDCDAALQHLRVLDDGHSLDMSRVVVLGHSAGGQLALALSSSKYNRGSDQVVPCLCLAMAPAPDMMTGYIAKLSDEGDAIERYMGFPPDTPDRRAQYVQASVSSHLPMRTPTLMVIGSEDTDVPPVMSAQLYRAADSQAEDLLSRVGGMDLLSIWGCDHFKMVLSGHKHWKTVARRMTYMLQQVCGWDIPPEPADYGVTQGRGFLPAIDPIANISSLAAPGSQEQELFKAWETCAHQLPSLLCSGSVRKHLMTLPAPRQSVAATPNWLGLLMQDDGAAEYAMLLLSFIAHGWVWGEKPTAQNIPEHISRPWVTVAKVLRRPPILTYFSFNACNWRRLDPQMPIELGNTCRLHNFLGGQDEEWFSAVHVAIEAQAGAAIHSAVRAKRTLSAFGSAISPAGVADITAHLNLMAEAMQKMHIILKRMKERCEPYIYYMRVRIFMSGWTHEDIVDGMEYIGVPATDDSGKAAGGVDYRKEYYFGETGAQSSVLPALDATLGVAMLEDELTPYLKAMRQYMPPYHAEFLSAMGAGPSLRALVQSVAAKDNQEADSREGDVELVSAYNTCLKELASFRGTHLELAHSFVRAFDERKDGEIRGTGGTPFMPYLKKHWRSTSELLVQMPGCHS